MPKGKNQKLKLYYLGKILFEKTDSKHFLTLPEIKTELLQYGITADRKSLYDDFQALRVLGIHVIGRKIQHNYYYHVTQKPFRFTDLKLLVDTIQSSSNLSLWKANDLIKKLACLTSKYEAVHLSRPVTVPDRIGNMRDSIFCSTNILHRAMAEDKQISFMYISQTPSFPMNLPDPKSYTVSPWELLCENEVFQLIAYNKETDCIMQFQVDMMSKIRIRHNKRIGRRNFRKTYPTDTVH